MSPRPSPVSATRVLAQPAAFAETVFEVANETTLQGSARLAVSEEDSRIGVLNFASARNPGGGFLAGAQAQEESLARQLGAVSQPAEVSVVLPLSSRPSQRVVLGSDDLFTASCPVFRRDDGALAGTALLRRLHHGSCAQCRSRSAESAEPGPRKSKVFSGSAPQSCSVWPPITGCEVLVLGAWGCGVFRNDPAMVAGIFRELLGPDGPIGDAFRRCQRCLKFLKTAGLKFPSSDARFGR